jgi:hypothetical protein
MENRIEISMESESNFSGETQRRFTTPEASSTPWLEGEMDPPAEHPLLRREWLEGSPGQFTHADFMVILLGFEWGFHIDMSGRFFGMFYGDLYLVMVD